MIALSLEKTQALTETDAWRKLNCLDETIEKCLTGQIIEAPLNPGRNVQILPMHMLPSKKGLSYVEGQARLLHDLASIEMQAMELNLRTLIEYPEASSDFRQQLAEVTREEGQHLGLCLEALQNLGFTWGSFPTHLALWQCVERGESLLDRILIVHRYLEGSGLDAGESILNRLRSVDAASTKEVVKTIAQEEIGHVKFGTDWYLSECEKQKINPQNDFRVRLNTLIERLPRRAEKINKELRLKAGFSDCEIRDLIDFQKNQISLGFTKRH